jgi:hypothetical protein
MHYCNYWHIVESAKLVFSDPEFTCVNPMNRIKDSLHYLYISLQKLPEGWRLVFISPYHRPKDRLLVLVAYWHILREWLLWQILRENEHAILGFVEKGVSDSGKLIPGRISIYISPFPSFLTLLSPLKKEQHSICLSVKEKVTFNYYLSYTRYFLLFTTHSDPVKLESLHSLIYLTE